MRYLVALVLATGLLGTSGSSQEPAPGSPLRALVDTERAFSRMSVEQGTREAFIAFFADDGVSFSPAPVNTKEAMTKRRVPAGQIPPVLAWEPLTADIAAAGDLGYAYGKYTSRRAAGAAAAGERGYYLRVWKRASEGWQIVADIMNPEPPGSDVR